MTPYDLLALKDGLYRLALRITMNVQEAEDVVQDTLLRLWSRRDQMDEVRSLEAFAMTTCRNLALDHLKLRDNRAASLDGMMLERVDTSPDPIEQMQRKQNLERVNLVLDSLPERYRTSIQLRDFEGKTYREIAEIMSISEENVKINIYRARKALKEALTPQ